MFAKVNVKNILIFSLIFGFLTQNPFAQDKSRPVTEKLEWAQDDNVLEYQIQVRNKASGEVKSFTTQQNFIEISEMPGEFEFRVKAVDILGREGSYTDWQGFRITKALLPSIESFPSEGWQIPETAVDSAVIPVDIKNIQPRSKAQLVNSATGEVLDVELVTRGSGSSLVATGLKVPVLNDGDWKIKVIDPSGKSSESGIIRISNPWPEIRQKRAEEEEKRLAEERRRQEEEQKHLEETQEEERRLAEEERRLEEKRRLAEEQRLAEEERIAEEERKKAEKHARREKASFELCAGYALPVILFDDVIPDYMKNSIWPASVCAKTNLIPLKTSAGNFGFGLSGIYSRMTSKFDYYTIEGNLVTGTFNLIYQPPLFRQKDAANSSQRFTLEFHGGAGLLGLLGFRYIYSTNETSKTMNSLNLCYDGGLSFKAVIIKGLYVEACCDFVYSSLTDMQLGLIIPQVCAGWKF
ncbi:hypothetical protein [Treponema sp. C6A8]|uniref:hypothetical protein n=1 Tax=Treponema sp. C6A8 TaxID=1410609 RepID=UPI0006859F7D|nr:hypothetical protein [Treponema sp. C6A8]